MLSVNFDSAEKPSVHPSKTLRTNGGAIQIIEDFPFHAEPSRSILRVFQQNLIPSQSLGKNPPPKQTLSLRSLFADAGMVLAPRSDLVNARVVFSDILPR